MGGNGSTGPEAVAAAEKNAAILTAKAGARDPSATPSICRVSAALQYPGGESSFSCDNIRSMPKIRGLSIIYLVMEELTFSPFGQFLLEGFSLYRKSHLPLTFSCVFNGLPLYLEEKVKPKASVNQSIGKVHLLISFSAVQYGVLIH